MSHAPRMSAPLASVDNDALSLRFLHRPIVFQEPERVVHPPSWLDFTPFAFWIIDALRPSMFVELGSHSGNSYASFAQAVQFLELPTTCYSVDTWRGDPHAGLYDEKIFEDWSAYHDRRFSTFSRLIRATFDEAVGHFSNGSIDLLHIDGYHTFEAVSHDFDAWRPKMSNRGVVLCHDIDVRERDFGAWRLWERLKDEYPCFDFRHGHGLGVLGVGPDVPEAVRWLLSLRTRNPERANTVRLFFSRLGATVLGRYHAAEAERTLHSEVGARDAQLAQATADRETLRAELDASQREVANLQAELISVTDAQTSADALLDTRLAEAERLASEVTSLHARIGALTNDVHARDERLGRTTIVIVRLRGELEESERRHALAQVRVRQMRDALSTAEEALVAHAAEAERLKVHATSRDAQLAQLELELDANDRALSAADMMARKLDGEAAALWARLQRDASSLCEETTRRRSLEALLSWTQAQVSALSALSHGGGLPAKARTTGTSGTVSRGLAIAFRSAGYTPAALAQVLRLAAVPNRLREMDVIDASGLFDAEWYVSQNPEVAGRGMHPLLHFVTIGAAEGRDPHPLFSTVFYVSQIPSLADSDQNPLHHYLTMGWRTGCSPHPLFDPAYYLGQNPDIARWGGDPLTHYLRYGGAEGRTPHPLFDVDFYLRESPEARTALDAGIAPLTHFVVAGARDRRRPSPFFDSVYYLDTYPDVAGSGVNPLRHFIEFGWHERRNPSAAFSVEDYLANYPDLRVSGENPLVHYVQYGRAQGRQAAPGVRPREGRASETTRVELSACSLAPTQDSRPTILLVSHVGPWRPRAGNEFRVHRMLRWYQQRGYRVVPVIAPLPGEELPREGVEGIAAEFGNAIQVHRDGRIEHLLRDVPDVFASLDGTFTSSFAELLEEPGASRQERELLTLERTFCHDALISTVLHLQRALGPHILQVEYIWMTRLLPLVRGHVLKVIDTHDVLSSIQQKVSMFGVRDVIIEPHQEAERLRRADLAIAIQDDERAELKQLAPSVPVITAGVDFDIVDVRRAPIDGQMLFVASDNARNRKGLEDFVRLAWPRIHQRVPHAELVVVGSVAKALDGSDVPGVRALGQVDDLTARYQEAALVINPVVAGTGLKIKILEALSHLRPIVTWPAGVDGLDPKLAAFCVVARDWYGFSEQVIRVLTGAARAGFTAAERAVIAQLVSPEHVYASVDAAFRSFFEPQPAAAEPNAVTTSVPTSRISASRVSPLSPLSPKSPVSPISTAVSHACD